MPYVEAVIFTKWKQPPEGGNVKADVIQDIFDWAFANGEFLPEVDDKGNSPWGKLFDLTGQDNVNQKILDNLNLYIAVLIVTTATAAQFAADPRIWTLGYRRFDDDGDVTFSNWDEPLTVEERQQAGDYVAANSKISKAQLAARFDVDDTRRDVAEKLKEFFRE